MAKKKSRYYPVVTGAPLSSGAAANTLVDGARILSSLNRRLYRMGRNYEFKIDVRPDYAGTPIEVYVLRDDWVVQKAFQMAYQQYLNSTLDEREILSKTQIARWEDFRVLSGVTLSVNQARAVMHQSGGGASSLNAGEFEESNVVDEAGNTLSFTWGAGTPGLSYGILEEYDKAANMQMAPAVASGTPTSQPYSGLRADIDTTQSALLQTDGNEAPYDRTGVNTLTPWVRVAVLGSTPSAQKLSSGFFTAPCGYVLLVGFGETSEAYSVSIEAKTGDYKGVHAPSMVEVATVNRKRKVVK